MALIDKTKQIRRVKHLPQVGVVALGQKVPVQGKEGVERPSSTGFFVFKTQDGIWQQALMTCYGDKPTRLFIAVPETNMGDYVHNVYQLRKGTQIFAETDNRDIWKIEDGAYVQSDRRKVAAAGGIEKAKTMLAEKHPGAEWKEMLMFQFFILPTRWVEDENRFEMPYATQVMTMGVFRMYTHGKQSIDNILSTLGMPSMSSYFAMDYTMKKTQKGAFPVITLQPVIIGNMGQNLLVPEGQPSNVPQLTTGVDDMDDDETQDVEYHEE